MGFFSGRMTCERYRVERAGVRQFGQEQIETLAEYAIGQVESASAEAAGVGFLAGAHLFDQDFRLEKNVINDALHCAVRVDTNAVPAALRRSWLQMELAALTAEDPGRRPSKAQRQQAQEAVDARCEEESRSGRFRRMRQFPLLWDAREGLLYFGGSGPAAEHVAALLGQAFEVTLERVTPGKLAGRWADKPRRRQALEEAVPSAFVGPDQRAQVAWHNGQSGNHDFLGNEFLLWLWWTLETRSEAVALADGSEVTGMLAKTLSLECPRGESGKETITAESPVSLPEARQAVRSGKLPRKSGLILARNSEQYELVLAAESFVIGGAKIVTGEGGGRGRGILEDRVESIRRLGETVDLLFAAFCQRRLGGEWAGELEQVRRWLQADPAATRKPAA